MRKKFMQLVASLENHIDPSIEEGQEAIIFSLVENGPMAESDLPHPDSLGTLIDEGYAVMVLTSDGDYKPGATRKGVNLYCKLVGEETVEKAIEKRKEQLANDPLAAETAIDQAEIKADDEQEDAINTRKKADELEGISQEAESFETVGRNNPSPVDATGQPSILETSANFAMEENFANLNGQVFKPV